jgi:hypothetical protein
MRYIVTLFLIGFASCSTFEPNFTTDHFVLGQASKTQLRDFLGEPDRIDTSSVQGMHTLIYSYRFTNPKSKPPELFRGVWKVPQKNLVLEFVKDSLRGYLYNNSLEHSSTDFNKGLRGRISIGRADKSTVQNLLGEPAGKIMLPTSLFSFPLLTNLTHVVPLNASEVWCYYYGYPYYRAGTRRQFEYYKFFTVYFNPAGVIVDKFYRESDRTEPRITRIYGR